MSLYAGTNGFLDGIPVEDVRRFEDGLLEWFRTRHGDILDGIKSHREHPGPGRLRRRHPGLHRPVPAHRRHPRGRPRPPSWPPTRSSRGRHETEAH